jgi:hypothetical protein
VKPYQFYGFWGDYILLDDNTNYNTDIFGSGYGLPQINPKMISKLGFAPDWGVNEYPERMIYLLIIIRKSDVYAGQTELAKYFDPDHPFPLYYNAASNFILPYKYLVVRDDDGFGQERKWDVICKSLSIVPGSNGWSMLASLQIVGDYLLRRTGATSDYRAITASGQTLTINNTGDAPTDPYFNIQPQSAKAVGFLYSRFVDIRWRGERGATRYPIDITNDSLDTDALQTAGKIQSDLDDLRVYVDGVEVDRFPYPTTDDTTTKVWCLLDWQADIPMTLKTAINNSVDEIEVNEDISDMPSSEGIIKIGSELITYAGKSNTDRKFTGCIRGAKYTTAASHSANADVYWIQHDIWIKYGNPALTAPSQDADSEPMFEIATSTNGSWDYDNFQQKPTGNKPAQWEYIGNFGRYGGNQGSVISTDYEELGLFVNEGSNSYGFWFVYNPLGWSDGNFITGEKYAEFYKDVNLGEVLYSSGITWLNDYDIPDVTALSTWQTWTRNMNFTSDPVYYIGLYLKAFYNDGTAKLECSDVTLTIKSTRTPVVNIGAEQQVYELDVRIVNQTTGDALQINTTCKLGERIQVHCVNKTVRNINTEESIFSALTVENGPRKHWMRLVPGNNVIAYSETGVVNVDFYFYRTERYYK